jgi:hypothetical protein
VGLPPTGHRSLIARPKTPVPGPLIYDRIRHVFEEEGEGHLVDGGLDNRVKHPFDQGSDKDREVDHFVQVCSVATNLGAPSQCNNAKRGTHV